MKKQNQILLLRISYWTGAIIEGIVAFELLLPDLWASYSGITEYTPNAVLTYALAATSALVFGYTALLIWADRKPLERKGILLIITFPVISMLFLNNVSAVLSETRLLQSSLVDFVGNITLAVLFTFSYLTARKEP